jgi:catalase
LRQKRRISCRRSRAVINGNPIRRAGEWRQQPEFAEPSLAIEGAADHWDFRKDDDDYYTQPGLLFRLMSAGQREALFGNTARAIAEASQEIKIRPIRNCLKADPAYGKGVAEALRIPLSEAAE